MNSPPAPPPISDESIELVRGALSELQSDHDETESFVNETLDDFEEIRRDLTEHEHKLRTQRDDLVERESQVWQTLSDLQRREETIASRRLELEAAAESLELLQTERDDAVRKLDEAANELASVANVLTLLETTEADLEETRRQLRETQSNLSDQPSGIDEDEIERVREENTRLHSELRKSQRESKRLAEQLSGQSHELELHKRRWSGEIGSMRERLEKHAASLKSAGSESSQDASADPESLVPSPLAPADETFTTNVEHAFATEDTVKSSGETSTDIFEKTAEDEAVKAEATATVEEHGEVHSPPAITDPVIGSVLARMEKLDQSDE